MRKTTFKGWRRSSVNFRTVVLRATLADVLERPELAIGQPFKRVKQSPIEFGLVRKLKRSEKGRSYLAQFGSLAFGHRRNLRYMGEWPRQSLERIWGHARHMWNKGKTAEA